MDAERHEDLRSTTIAGRLRLAKGEKTWRAVQEEARISQRTLELMLYPPPGTDDRGRGKRGPTLDVIGRLAAALAVRPGWLAFGDEAMR